MCCRHWSPGLLTSQSWRTRDFSRSGSPGHFESGTPGAPTLRSCARSPSTAGFARFRTRSAAVALRRRYSRPRSVRRVPASLQFFVQRVQVEVRQQRGERSGGVPSRTPTTTPSTRTPLRRYPPISFSTRLSRDGPDSPHHDVVMHPVKELLDVQIDDPVPASTHGIVSAGPGRRAVLAEPRFDSSSVADPAPWGSPGSGFGFGITGVTARSRPATCGFAGLLKPPVRWAVHPRRPPVAEYRSQGRPVVVRRDHLFHQRLVPLPSFRVFAATETRSPPFRLDGFHPWAFRTGARGSLPGSRLRSSWRLHWRHKVGTTPSVLRSTGITRLLRYYDLC